VVLALAVRELGLQEDLGPGHDAGPVGGGQPGADAGLEVVAALVGGVQAAEAQAERQLGERGGPLFLPGRAVEEVGDAPAGQPLVLPAVRPEM
jgi:hypothetical protein